MFGQIESIHLVGIGGSGMCGIAEVLINWGYKVTGSDLLDSTAVQRLRQLGAKISIGHQAQNISDAQVVVKSTAVSQDNPEIKYALDHNIPVIPRAEMLMELMRRKQGIAVAGAHGKTTTTSLILSVLGAGNLDPTAIIGGKVNAIGSNARLGAGEVFIAEADESDGSFLTLTPMLSVITNIDHEHLDYYPTPESIEKAFVQFANRVPFYGATIACIDDPWVKDILPQIRRRVVTYGLSSQSEIRGVPTDRQGGGQRFEVFKRNQKLGEVFLQLPGTHNILNALAAIAVGLECQVDFEKIRLGLKQFSGIERRFQLKGEKDGVVFLDDYAHHPKEIHATLKACREVYPKRRLVAAFQPHRYSRLAALMTDFAKCFDGADEVALLPVYSAGEDPQVFGSPSSNHLAENMQAQGYHSVKVYESFDQLTSELQENLREGDLFVTLGAGSIWKCHEPLLLNQM